MQNIILHYHDNPGFSPTGPMDVWHGEVTSLQVLILGDYTLFRPTILNEHPEWEPTPLAVYAGIYERNGKIYTVRGVTLNNMPPVLWVATNNGGDAQALIDLWFSDVHTRPAATPSRSMAHRLIITQEGAFGHDEHHPWFSLTIRPHEEDSDTIVCCIGVSRLPTHSNPFPQIFADICFTARPILPGETPSERQPAELVGMAEIEDFIDENVQYSPWVFSGIHFENAHNPAAAIEQIAEFHSMLRCLTQLTYGPDQDQLATVLSYYWRHLR